MDIFLEEHKQLLSVLSDHNVQFILIGGYAVIYYGYQRTTGDMDIWLQLGSENKNKLLEALHDFGIEEYDLQQLRQMYPSDKPR
jgi:predicted nucleotidyltransferase